MLIRELNQFLMWGSFILFPLFLEMVKNITFFSTLIHKRLTYKKTPMEFLPYITIMIPVFNSSKTLKMCLDSIANQTYPLHNLEVMLLNNGVSDQSYDIFQDFQGDTPTLKLWWMNSDPGKSNALNKGIYCSGGKYIINIDSDGWLDKNAITNVVSKFEADSKIASMTGVVLIDPIQIEQTQSKWLKLLQKCEFFEYIESFLIGRIVQAQSNNLYTMAGAFSCFRRDAILKTQLYNTSTLGEDTHMTFQIRKFVGGKVSVCDDAFLFVDPIESVDKLYMQRQRWQTSEIEVARLFSEFHRGGLRDLFLKPTMRLMIADHTLALLKLIWSFSIVYFLFIGYPLKYFFASQIILYVIYAVNSSLYSWVATMFLKSQPHLKKYMKRNMGTALIMMGYRVMTYMIRMAGIINSVKVEKKWYAKPLSKELSELFSPIKKKPHAQKA